MDSKIISKLVRLKMQEYNLFKELLPNCIKNEVNNIESRAVKIAKEIAVELMQNPASEPEENEKKTVKKVTIES